MIAISVNSHAFRPVIEAEISDKTAGTEKDSFSWGGRIFTDQYLYSQTGKLAQSSFSSWLELSTKNENGLGGHAVGALTIFGKSMDRPDRASVTGQLREAYFSYRGDGTSIKLGQQIIPWGKSDGINATDYFSAKDYSLLNPDDEVRRTGAPGLNLSFTPESGNSPFTYQFIFQVYSPQNKLLIPSQIIPQGLTVNLKQPAPSLFRSNAMQFGGKIAYQKSNFDFSISAFKGKSAFPEFVFNPATLAVDLVNFKETAFGADASITLKDYVVQFESAVHLLENGGRDHPLFGSVEPDHWDTTLGIERPVLDDFRVQFQFLYRYHLYFREQALALTGNPLLDQLNAGIARANATLLNFKQRGNPGATFRLSYANENSKWSGDFFFVGYFQAGEDFLLRPEIGYSPFTDFKLLAGMDYYGGNASRPLGALSQLSDLFLEAKYVF